jgi:hypothetical protein
MVATSPSASPLSSASSGMMYGNEPFVTSPSFSMQPGSPDSLMSGLSSAPLYRMTSPPQLVQSSSTSTTTSAAATAYLNETIAKASALPESFYPEFLQYSKESFEQQSTTTTTIHTSKKRSRLLEDEDKAANKRQFSSSSSSSCSSEEDDEEDQQRPSRKQKVE